MLSPLTTARVRLPATQSCDALTLAESVMGADFLVPRTFRFGASGVLDALLDAAGESAVAGATGDGY